MFRRFILFSLVVWIAGLGTSSDGQADSVEVPETRLDPRKAIVLVYKNFRRVQGYDVSFSHIVGTTRDGGRTMARTLGTLNYSGISYRGIIRVSGEDLFITRKGGACYDEIKGRWWKLSTITKGRVAHLLFETPGERLELAARHASKARWISDSRLIVSFPKRVAQTQFCSIQNSLKVGCNTLGVGTLANVRATTRAMDYEIELDLDRMLPKTIRIVTRGKIGRNGYEDYRGEMTYSLSRFDRIAPFPVPKGAVRYLR